MRKEEMTFQLELENLRLWANIEMKLFLFVATLVIGLTLYSFQAGDVGIAIRVLALGLLFMSIIEIVMIFALDNKKKKIAKKLR